VSPAKPRGVGDKRGAWSARDPVFLLDVNVLIALLDPMHIQHARARDVTRLLPTAQVTDSYLLALAVKQVPVCPPSTSAWSPVP
jgi:hypothetical protein